MAFLNASTELQKRVMTGVIGGGMLLLLIIFGGWLGIFFLASLLSLGMIYEFCEITYTMTDKVEKRYVMLCLTWFVGLVNLLAPQSEFELLVLLFLLLFIYYLFTVVRHEDALFQIHFKELMYSLFGAMYLIFLPLYIPKIYNSGNGVEWTILLLLIVFSNDTGAYFTGRKYGKNKLFPRISPKKTREGSLGGLAAGLVIAFLYKVIVFRAMSWLAVPFMPLLVGATAQVGDLCESFFKRAFDKKDSGNLLPGHGGFMDRFDGVVFSLPVMYACIKIFG